MGLIEGTVAEYYDRTERPSEEFIIGALAFEKRYRASGKPDTSRLDAVQGNSEARTELYGEVLLGSTGADDAVMRQESRPDSELGSEAGQDGGGAW